MEKQELKNVKNWAAVYNYPLHKTAIAGEKPYLFHVVTRVNYHTANLWLENRKLKIKGFTEKVMDLPAKPNWLVMIKIFRRDEDKRISLLIGNSSK